MHRPLRSPLIGLGLLGVSCLPGGKLPALSAPPSRGGPPLRPLEADLPPDEGPLKLAFSTPQGDEVEAPLPTFVFTRSMHRLGAPPDDPPVVAAIDPPLEGSWRWIGARALQFSPRGAFAQATRYRVEVRSQLRSLDGQTLEEPLRLDFATPRLRVLDLSLGDASDGILTITFNQPVAPAALEKAFSLVDEDAKKVPFRIDSKEPSSFFVLRPRPRWPAGVALRATLAPLSGVEGPLGTTEPRLATFRERQPVGVERLTCSQARNDDICEEDTSVELSLGEPLSLAQLRPLVKIDPPIPFQLKPDGKPYLPSTSFTLEAAFKLGVRYRVSVRSSPPRRRGQPGLDTGAELSFRTAPPEPHASLLVHGTYLHPAWTRPLHATVERVDSARFSVTPLTLAALLERRREPAGKQTAAPSGELSFTASTDEERQWAAVPLGALFPETPGPLILAASWKGASGQGETSRILQRTDLALSARLSPEGSLLWVTRLSSGLPVAGAEVEIHDLDGHKIAARTDPQGLATLDLSQLPASAGKKGEPSRDQLLLIARSGDDWIYEEARRPREARLEATLFTDRDIYRPGEVLFLKGVVRQSSTRGPISPEGRELSLTLELPDGPPLTLVKKLSAWGAFSHEFTLPPDTPPRAVRLLLKESGESKSTLAAATVKVRHVREASFKVSAALDRPHYLPGDPFTCRAQASYLYGGSMKSMPYDATVTARASRYAVPGLEGFLVGDGAWFHGSRPLLRHRGNLDADGAVAQGGKVDDTDTSRLLRCGVAVTDPGQQTMEGEATAWVHPAEFYVALKEIGWREAEAGKELKLQLAAASPEGQRRAERVKATLLEERPRDGKDQPDLVPVTSCSVLTSTTELASCSLRIPPRHETRYRVEASATDAQGRVARTITSFRTPEKPRLAAPPLPPPPPRPLPPPRPPLLALDKSGYRPGETARLTISPATPFHRGLLVVEREGIFSRRVFSAQESPLDLPITAAMAPAAHLDVVLQRPVPVEPPYQRLEAQERAGQLLSVARPSRKLQVNITPSRTEAAPGETLTVEVKVTDAGAPARAEVTLYAVNEGMLQLSGYQVPDLEERLPLRGEHLVLMRETRAELGWLDRPYRGGTGTGQGFGSGHGRLGGSHRTITPSLNLPRSDFRPTPLFLPSLETDAEGNARASFKLPDSLTAYRIMAVAADRSDHFGRAETTVTAKLAAQIRPVIPQVIRAGDRFEAAAIAANNTAAALDVAVSLQAEGFETPAGAPRRLRLEAGASERVTFPVEARRVGPGKLTFRLEAGNGLRDAAEAPLTAQSPVSLEASALYGKTEQSTLESVADLSAIRGDVGGLDLTVSSSPVAGLAPGLEQLIEYPYGCTEQLTSRLVPLVALRELARSLAVALPEDAEDASKRAVEALLKNRHKDGRFGLWPSSVPSPWITAYAYWGLSEVHRRGLPVDAAIFREAASHLLDLAARWPEGKRQAAEATFALDVLVDLPEADDTARSHALLLARQMADHRAELPAFARFQLLHALARLAAPADELAPVLREVEASLHLDGPLARVVEPAEWYPALLDTRTRSSAMALRALLAAAPGHPMLEPLARGLIADRGPKGWKTTQESTWALLALDGYRSALGSSEAARSARVSVGGQSLLEAPLRGLAAESRVQVTMAELARTGGADLLFQAEGGPVYYQARLRYAPVAAPTTPWMAGIEVAHRCGKLDAKESGEEAAFQVGDWVVCRVEVTTPSPRRFVVVDAPIPGGFEIADPSLDGTPARVRSASRGSATHREIRPDRMVYFADQLSAGVHRWSYAAKATTAGEYVVPPTRAEEMYTPETYGRTAATTVRIAR